MMCVWMVSGAVDHDEEFGPMHEVRNAHHQESWVGVVSVSPQASCWSYCGSCGHQRVSLK